MGSAGSASVRSPASEQMHRRWAQYKQVMLAPLRSTSFFFHLLASHNETCSWFSSGTAAKSSSQVPCHPSLSPSYVMYRYITAAANGHGLDGRAYDCIDEL